MRTKWYFWPAALLSSALALGLVEGAPAQTLERNALTAEGIRPRLSVAWQLGISSSLGPLVSDTMLVMRQIGAVGVGLSADYSFTRVLGVEAALAWTPSTVAMTDWEQTVDRTAAVWLGSLRARILAGASPNYALVLTPGVGMVDRRGAAWRGMQGMRRAALVFGAGLSFLGQGPFSYGIEVQDYLSRAAYRDSIGTAFSTRLHNDLLVTFSVRYAVIVR